MNIFFDEKMRTFGASREGLLWGGNERPLPLFLPSSSVQPFLLRTKENKVGPIIGLLTTKRTGYPFIGNPTRYRKISRLLQEQGGFLYVFTPEGMKNEEIHGFFYSIAQKKWIKSQFPYPDVVYNRIPIREDEQLTSSQYALQAIAQKNIPLFNPHFFNKNDVFRILYQNKKLREFLPDTRSANSVETISEMLKEYDAVYVKPVDGHKGDDIFTVEKKNNAFQFQSSIRRLTFSSEHLLSSYLSPLLKKQRYIAQNKINLNKQNSRMYDFRVLIQRVSTEWLMTGFGIRCAPVSGITTHVPKGGSILSKATLDKPIDEKKLTSLSMEAAKTLEQAYPALREFSMDIGRDVNGSLWIFEANSKPMKFDERDIDQKMLCNLVATFFYLSKFNEY
ncbi:YheC/YheD family protein [Fictibacillus sp. Mic-4]|uniref:YheC/YheD family endospore coat-associated protein n=1 Tax=Fictibacillus sp. Mic-4 TaxID=3132826 RepID=UPI003CFAA904